MNNSYNNDEFLPPYSLTDPNPGRLDDFFIESLTSVTPPPLPPRSARGADNLPRLPVRRNQNYRYIYSQQSIPSCDEGQTIQVSETLPDLSSGSNGGLQNQSNQLISGGLFTSIYETTSKSILEAKENCIANLIESKKNIETDILKMVKTLKLPIGPFEGKRDGQTTKSFSFKAYNKTRRRKKWANRWNEVTGNGV
ncbi:hypothetical protein K502DRAFT_325526 [Neoconidiobolus thromboides FSU 785]|nr:hypothetical protein K502DRAFT_325526 [Neoconidiobolus thromboides FSU 785]